MTHSRTSALLHRAALLIVSLAICLMASPAARAAGGGFHLASTSLFVHENQGAAVIEVQRSDARRAGQVGYIAVGPGHPCGASECTAQYGWDFTFVKGVLSFPAGVTTESFQVPIVDHHADTIPQTVQISLFFGYPALGSPSTAVLTILNDDPLPVESKLTSASDNPLAGQHFFADPQAAPAQLTRRYPALSVIARQPWVERFGTFSGPDVDMAVAHYLARASVQAPGQVPELSTYRLVDLSRCGGAADSPAQQASYRRFIERFAAGIGSYHAVLFLEMDSLITVGCLSPYGVSVRMHELRDAIQTLSTHCPRLVIYLDAGAADAVPAKVTAGLLRRAGVARIRGFFTNSTHYDWTRKEIRYGERISHLLGSKHFVVNTSMNGRGPLAPADIVRDGNEVLCNPPGRGLGPLPTGQTGVPNVDGFAWILHAGESTGACGAGAPPTGDFWAAYALMLVRNANFHIR